MLSELFNGLLDLCNTNGIKVMSEFLRLLQEVIDHIVYVPIRDFNINSFHKINFSIDIPTEDMIEKL